MKEQILQLLEDKVNDTFLEMQNRLNIQHGDISPLQQWELDNCISELADKIEEILCIEV